jgi:hypothetical protein
MSDRGIVIFHDVNCLGNEKAFTTHLFWDEIRAKYPSFTFAVGPGLGILAAGNEIPDPLKFILSADADTAEKIQSIFGNRGMSLKRLFDSQLLHHDYLITLLKLTAPARFVNRKLMRFRPYRKLVTRVFRRG